MSAPCQVDFYVLEGSEASAERLACHLAMRAWESGHRVLLRAAGEAQAKSLDELMWDFPPGRLVPHGRGVEGDAAPVCIGIPEDGFPAGRDLVINMTAETVPQPERYQRVLEIVPAEDTQREVSRTKFRIYREQGLNPGHHPINKI
jgi:DNA polymerase-3 subunit chi